MELSGVKSDKWTDRLAVDGQVYIAGPCSAETRDQVLTTARLLQGGKVKIFRAGVWKPRTRPGNFEGVGAVALPWLREVYEQTGLLPAVEVANAVHVEKVLEYGIPVLWIGARTTTNPFAVQEIADALRGNDELIVLIKNPVNPDIDLWTGALERIHKAGIKSLGLVHRGFSVYRREYYRNVPGWQIPVEIKTRFPHIPLLNDPSHICGRRDCIENIAQTALDLQFDGFMIEVHPDPDHAWSDAAQQITPDTLNRLLEKLIIRHPGFTGTEVLEKLNELRREIDKTDGELLRVLKKRLDLTGRIATEKRLRNVAVLQPARWKEIRENVSRLARELGLEETTVLNLYGEIHQASIRLQEKIINQKEK